MEHAIILSAGHPEEQPGHKIYRPNGQTRPELCRMRMRTGVRPHVKVACPIGSCQIRKSIVDFPAPSVLIRLHLKWGGQAHGAQGDSDCLYRRTIFEAHSFFWCFAAGVDVLQSRAVVYSTVRYSTSRVHLL